MSKPAAPQIDLIRLTYAVDAIAQQGGCVSRVRGYTQAELNAACEMLFRMGFCDVRGFGDTLNIPPQDFMGDHP